MYSMYSLVVHERVACYSMLLLVLHALDTVTVATKRGGLVAYLSTPTVAAVVRSHFNCPSLPGAELENQSGGGSCFGSHWERRLFPTEYMNSYLSHSPVFSALTLAFFKVCVS